MISGNQRRSDSCIYRFAAEQRAKAGVEGEKALLVAQHAVDHIAILLDEPGAGTPEGVGMFIADGQEADVESTSLIGRQQHERRLVEQSEVLPEQLLRDVLRRHLRALRMSITNRPTRSGATSSVSGLTIFVYEEDGDNAKPKLFDQKYSSLTRSTLVRRSSRSRAQTN